MCGIAGFQDRSNQLNEETLHFFTTIQHHRGPDSKGIYRDKNMGLAHNRLSILDTSTNASQPFHSACGRYVMVFNGEVYNYKEIATKYTIQTKTTSDTEVIIECFAKIGTKCVNDFRGMFAIAIYDREEESLTLIRDRFGIKPLYYYSDKNTFVFSSELKTIAELPSVKAKLTIDQDAIHHYLHLGFVPSPESMYSEIKKFPSGHVGKLHKNGRLEVHEYWNAENYRYKNDISYEEAKKKVKDLLYLSVEEHLVSDVPTGIFLSGGIDSSLLAAIATDISPNKLQSFTVGFKNNEKDEIPFAKIIAKKLGLDHHETYLTENDTARFLHQMKTTFDEPFADTSAIPTLLVSEFASKKVKVALSGEGADELFLGYGTHLWAKRLENKWLQAAKIPIQLAYTFTKNTKLGKTNQMLSKVGTQFLAANIYSIEHGFYSADEINTSGYQGYVFDKQKDLLTQQLFFELEVALKDGLLVKMDRATMQFGLEARVPYLDNRLVEFVLGLDDTFKTQNGYSKRILKDLLFEMLPKSYFERPKWGFGMSKSETLEKILKTGESKLSLQKAFCQYQLSETIKR